MEFTKFEKMVLSEDYLRKCRWHYLYLGLLFVAIGITVFYYGSIASLPSYEAVWERSARVMEKVVPASPKDQELLNIAITNMKLAKEGNINFLKEKTKSLTLIFLFVGFYLLAAYFREVRYHQLLLKSNLMSQHNLWR